MMVAVFGLLTMLEGCGGLSGLYLHDAARQKAAEAAKTGFESIVQKGRVSSLVASYEAQQAVAEETFRTLHAEDDKTQLTALLPTSWKDLLDSTKTELENTKTALAATKVRKTVSEKKLKEALEKLPAVQKETNSLVEAMNAAAMAEAGFAATQSLLRESMRALIGKQKGGSANKLKEVLDKTVPVRSFSLDDAGNLVEKPTQPPKTIGKVLGLPSALVTLPSSAEEVLAVISALPKMKEIQNLTLKDPGISTTIIGLAFDLSRAEERRLGAKINQAKRKIKLFDEHIAFLERQAKAMKRSARHLKGFADEAVEKGDEQVRDTVGRLSQVYLAAHRRFIRATSQEERKSSLEARKKVRGTLHSLYVELAKNYEIRVVNAKDRIAFDGIIDGLEVEKALAVAEANLNEREAVILRGLEGLVAFYQGGITPDDINAVIGLAQSIGIFVIAGRQ